MSIDVSVAGEPSCFEGFDADFQGPACYNDEDEGEPPERIPAEAVEESIFDVVDHIIGICRCQDDIPQEPATDAEDHCDDARKGFVVDLPELHLCSDDDDAGGKGEVAHGVEAVIGGEERLAVEAEHDEEDDDGLRGGHGYPSKIFGDVEAVVIMAKAVVELWYGEKGGCSEVLFKYTHEYDGEGGEERVEHCEGPLAQLIVSTAFYT